MQDQSSQVFPSGNLPCKTDSLDYVVARIAHIKESTLYHHEKPYMILSAGDVKIPKTNCFFTAGNNVIIRDLRASGPGLRDANDFDSQGFAYLSNVPSAVNPSMDKFKSSDMPAELLEYLEETRMFVNGYFKADKTICFDWRLRTSYANKDSPSEEDISLARTDPIPPAYKAHADLSYQGGLKTLEAYLNEQELGHLRDGSSRFRIINCWRPLVGVVEDVPLAMCDRRNVQEADWLPYDRIDDTGPGEGLWLKQREWYKWYWYSQMTKHDIILFRSWDSKAPEFQGHTPHAAFVNPAAKKACEPRASIEVRLIAITSLSRD
ncbi:hypothetical protein HDV63DRAFT_396876 [Trichoderma sp. SZMC 28014]